MTSGKGKSKKFHTSIVNENPCISISTLILIKQIDFGKTAVRLSHRRDHHVSNRGYYNRKHLLIISSTCIKTM